MSDSVSEPTFEMTREDLEALCEKFRELKHSLNNTLAVIMALSELSQRNTNHYEKLARTVLHRGPDVVAQLTEFQHALGAKLKPGSAEDPVDAAIKLQP